MYAPLAMFLLATPPIDSFVGVFEGTVTHGAKTSGIVLQFENDGGKLKARYCKRGGRNCQDLEDVVIDRNHVLANMTFENPAEPPNTGLAVYRMVVSLDLSADGRQLTGTAFSTKCNCVPALSLTKTVSP